MAHDHARTHEHEHSHARLRLPVSLVRLSVGQRLLGVILLLALLWMGVFKVLA